jgi:hypothetical protein
MLEVDARVVDEQIQRLVPQCLGEIRELIGRGHIEPMQCHLGMGGRQSPQIRCGIGIAAAGKDPPTARGALPHPLEAEPLAGAGDQCRCHSVPPALVSIRMLARPFSVSSS